MEYPNSPQLQSWLEREGWGEAARAAATFAIPNQAEFEERRGMLVKQGAIEGEINDRAAFHCLTHRKASAVDTRGHIDKIRLEIRTIKETQVASAALAKDTAAKARKDAWIRYGITAVIVIAAILYFAIRGHAQNNPNVARVTATCATPPTGYPTTGVAPLTTDPNGNLCAGVTVSATVSTAGLAINFGAGTSGGNTGPAYPAAVYSTSAAPSYTEGKFNALSSDLSGNLRVNAAVTVPGSLTVTTPLGGGSGAVTVVGSATDGTTATFSPVQIGGIDDSGKIQAVRTTAAGNTVVSLETTAGVIGAVTIGSTVNVNFLTAAPNVTIANGAGAAAVNIQDGGNSITVDGTVSVGNTVNVNFLTAAPNVTIASGTTTVTQATGSNLHVVVDTAPTTAVTIGATVNVQGVTGGVAVTVAGQTAGVTTAIVTDTTGREVVVGAANSGQIAQGAPVLTGGSDGTNVRSLKTATDGTLQVGGTITVTDGAGALNVIVDSGTVTVQGVTGGIAVLTAASSGGTVTATPMNQNGLKVGAQICDSASLCATVTGGKLDVNATVSANANQIVSTTKGGDGGEVAIVGMASDGATATFSPVRIGGKDDAGKIETIRTTAAGNPVVSLETTSGVIGHIVSDSGSTTVVTGTVVVQGTTGGVAVAVSGQSGGTQVEIATDTTGREIMVGAAPNLSGNQGAPVRIGGTTASTTYDIVTDAQGRQVMVGATPSGGITQGAPVLIAGATGGNTYSLTADANGHFLSHPPLYNTVWNATALGALVNVANSSGNVLAYLDCQNSSTSANAFVQVFNVPATSVTLGTTVATEVHMVPFGGGFVLPNMNTLYQNAISIASTTTATGASTQASVCTARVTPQ